MNFVFTALDSQQRAVSESSFSEAINANGANTLNVTLGGVVDHVTLALSSPGVVSYQNGSATVSATAYDVDNDIITGTYFAPIVLSVSGDTTGTITVPTATLASSSATGTIAYTFSAATQYTENHVVVKQTSATETTAAAGIPFEVGRTFYTFTSSNTIVGFLPGATTPTRTVTMPTLDLVEDVSCDGSNVYLSDGEDGAIYGLAPTATSVTSVTYTSALVGPGWVAANGGIAPSTYAQMYVANGFGAQGIGGFQGGASAPPFPLPPNSVVQSGGGSASRGSIVFDSAGNVYASLGGPNDESGGGYEVRDPTLATVYGTGTNVNSEPADLIAIDTTVSPARIYVSTYSTAPPNKPEVDEYDNYAATPTYVSSDSNGTGLFTDSTGRIYTSKALAGPPPARVRNPGHGTTSAQRRTLAGTGNVFDVYAPGGLAGTVQYTIPGESLAIDSGNYVYALQDGGSINVYAPGTANLVYTITGTNYGAPSPNAFAFELSVANASYAGRRTGEFLL